MPIWENFLNSTGQQMGTSLGGSVAGSLGGQIGYGLGELTGYNDALKRDQLQQQQALTEIQKNANLGLMKESYKQQLEMWKNTNYQAQMKELQLAGLNPALMYGHAGAGGTTGGGGASVGGGNASGTAQMQEANNISSMNGMAMMKLASEIKLNEAQAKKLNSEVPKIEADTNLSKSMLDKVNTEITNISADTALKGEQVKLNQLQQDSTRIANEFNEKQNIQLLKQTFQQIRELTATSNVAESTQQSLVELAKANVENVLSNTILNNSKVSLNEMEKSVMRQKILEIVNSISVSQGQLQINKQHLEQTMEITKMNLSSSSVINTVRGITQAIFNAISGVNDYSY